MDSLLSNVKSLYEKDKKLNKEDVNSLLQWVSKQQHLPKINEFQAILFNHSCQYRNEPAKTAIDNFFTFRTRCPEFFTNRNPSSNTMQTIIDLSIITILPKRTSDGDRILFIKFVDSNSEKFTLLEEFKYVDMVCMLNLYQKGPSNGQQLVVDLNGLTFGHVLKLGPLMIKRFLYYMQEAMPINLKSMHFINPVPFMDKILTLIKPFLKKELLEALHIHNTLDSLTKYIPIECLPKDYGGGVDTIANLHEKIRKNLVENSSIFEWEETLTVDESKRMKPLKDNDIYGIDGTFKQLEID